MRQLGNICSSLKMKAIINKVNFIIKKGFLHIFGARVVNRVIQFVTSVVIVRLLSKESYGSFSYAMNILQFFLLFSGLGVASGVLQFCSEKSKPEEKLPYLKYGLKIGVSFNVFIALIIVIFVSFFELPVKGSSKILSYLVLIPVFIVSYELMETYLIANFKNREFSYLSISNALFYFLGALIGGYLFEVYGVIAGRYLAFIFSISIGLKYFIGKAKSIKKAASLIKRERIEFLKYSVVACLTISISQLLFLLDIFLVGLIIREQTVVASYKAATLIPFALNFIPGSIMIFAYPYFAKNLKDKNKIKSYFYEMQKYLIFLNLGISFVLFVFAPLIIRVIFGTNYMDSLIPFRILAVGYFIAGSFRIPAGNVIASIRKIKINLYNGIISGILNIVLDIILIYKFGAVGAAIATTGILFISSMISNVYLFNYFRR